MPLGQSLKEPLEMIFRPIDYSSDPLGFEGLQLISHELFGDNRFFPPSMVREAMDHDNHFCLEDEWSGSLVGVGSLGLENIDTHLAWINNVAIVPAYRGEGLGKELIRSLEAQAYNQGALVVRLVSLETAEDFYKKLGYSPFDDVSPLEYIKNLV